MSLDRFMVHKKSKDDLEFEVLNVNEPLSSQHVYDLYAMVNHTGSMHGGHYIAYVSRVGKDGKKVWFSISDSHM